MDDLYKMHAEMCKIFSNATRLEILDLLRRGELSVNRLTAKTGLSQANVSQHLAIMKAKGVVTSKRRGQHVYYGLTNPKIIKAFDIIREILSERMQRGGFP